MSKFERAITFEPAFDKRSSNPSRNFGTHGVNMRWLLKGPLGAIQFVVYTNWHLPHVTKERDARCSPESAFLYRPMPADIGYHSLKPRYEEQNSMPCDVLPGGKCYYDGSTLNAEPVFDLLVREGGEAVWQRLEQDYERRFQKESEA